MENNVENALQREINYYKQQVLEMSQSILKLQYQNIQSAHITRQMKAGLSLIAGLKEMVSSNITMDELYDIITEMILSKLMMDQVLILQYNNDQTLTTIHVKGFDKTEMESITQQPIPFAFAESEIQNPLVVTSDTKENVLINVLRAQLKLTYFIFTPVLLQNRPFAYLIAGRKKESHHSSGLKFMLPDADILNALAGLISTLKIQIDQNVILEQNVAIRTHQLYLEKKKSDELLLNILPEEVAEELKAKGSADAKQFDVVTVMFTDFKGFTSISERLTPSELVAEIHTCFKAFDNIITKYNIEKIKTIGDSYMCAGGLPVANKTNPDDVVKAALEIQQFMLEHLRQRRKENKEVFEIRIGIHTGPVVAGIVGVKKYAYDIWGDTVNIASRMESSGEAGKVNISGNTYALVKGKFKCLHRGKVQAKNKGEIDMYFVETP